MLVFKGSGGAGPRGAAGTLPTSLEDLAWASVRQEAGLIFWRFLPNMELKIK